MNLLQDIFKILHQPVQLLIAALMFAYKEPKRKFWLIRAVLAAILGFLVLELCITASPEILLNSFFDFFGMEHRQFSYPAFYRILDV
mgnify:CR=1 FL=1